MRDDSTAEAPGLWQEMRQRWQRAAVSAASQERAAQAWRESPDLPSLAEILARLPRRSPAPELICCP